jgi:YD repeat-containing protein
MGRSYNVTYSRVEEIINDGSQGKRVYHFSKIGDIVPNPSVSIAQINYDWTYGIPTKTEVFEGSGTNLQKIEEKSYQYKTFITNNSSFQASAGPSSFYSFGMKLNRERAEVEPGQQWLFKPAVYNLFKYGYVSALISKIKETTKVFENGIAIESNVFYSIDSINNQIIKSVYRGSSTNGDGKSRYFFYTDEIGGQSAYTLYKEPILYLDKKIRGGIEYTIGGAYFPLSTINGKRVIQKAYSIDLQSSTRTYSLSLSDPTSSAGFRLASEVLAYNLKNYPSLTRDLEMKTKTLYDNTGTKPVAYVQNFNASDSDIAFSSFEYTDNKGGWTYSGTPITTTYKTGKKAYNLSSGSVTKTGIGASSSNPYKVGFWARMSSGSGNVIVGGQTESLTTTWKWVEKNIASSSLTISGSSVIIDELRLYPAESMMTSFTYEPLVGVTSQTDPKGYTITYVYDASNRLITIKDEEGNILEHYEYNYATGN